MAKKFRILVLLITIGFFLMPNLILACEMKSEKSCCKKEMSSKETKKDCCKKNKDNKDENQDKRCNGKCGHSNCTTSNLQFNLAFFEVKIKNNLVDFTQKKQNFIFTETNISSGFSTLWLIPKIG